MESRERKISFSIAFEPSKLARIRELASRVGTESVGAFVRDAVRYHMEATEDAIRCLEREARSKGNA